MRCRSGGCGTPSPATLSDTPSFAVEKDAVCAYVQLSASNMLAKAEFWVVIS